MRLLVLPMTCYDMTQVRFWVLECDEHPVYYHAVHKPSWSQNINPDTYMWLRRPSGINAFVVGHPGNSQVFARSAGIPFGADLLSFFRRSVRATRLDWFQRDSLDICQNYVMSCCQRRGANLPSAASRCQALNLPPRSHASLRSTWWQIGDWWSRSIPIDRTYLSLVIDIHGMLRNIVNISREPNPLTGVSWNSLHDGTLHLLRGLHAWVCPSAPKHLLQLQDIVYCLLLKMVS